MAAMHEVVYARCCGLDVHKDTVVACVRLAGPAGRVEQEVRTFGTTTRALLELGDWLAEKNVAAIAMESSGVYWKPGGAHAKKSPSQRAGKHTTAT